MLIPSFREAVLAVAVLTIGTTIVARIDDSNQTSTASMDLEGRLNIASLYIDGLDGPYNQELERLDKLCPSQPDGKECRERNLRSTAVKAGSVHLGPSATSRVLGDLYAVMVVHPSYGVGYRLDFRPSERQEETVVWLDSIGDWGYGIEIAGVRIEGQWIQLIGGALPATSWIDGTQFGASAESIEGSLITVPAIPATTPDGTRVGLEPGSYVVERVRGTEVTIRQEVPTDFPCGEEVKAPSVMPPSMRVAASALFAQSGKALFSSTYGKGC